MKKIYLTMIAVALIAFSCDEDSKPVDPIYEFVAFKGNPSVDLNEFNNSVDAYPLVIELKAFKPYDHDLDIGLEVIGNGAEENVDFTISPRDNVKIRAGKLVSDTIFISTIDNSEGTATQRSFDIRIKSINNSDINVGLGLTEPRNAAISVNILDDECTETTAIFNGPLVNTLDGGDVMKPATGVLTGNTIKVSGDLIDYGPFSSASISITLTPRGDGATKGTATFGEQAAGTDSDGYEYKFIQTGEGSYDVCNGIINVSYDIYYMDGDWVYWYSVTNEFSVE